MLNILTEQNVQRSLRELQPQDILIAPDLGAISFFDFGHVQQAIDAGARAARALAAQLAPLSLASAEYALFEQRRLAPPALADVVLPLARVEVGSDGGINPAALAAQSGLRVGKNATLAQVRRGADTLYGRGDLARVETDIDDADGKRTVLIRATEAPWARSRLRVGLELASDFDEANSFALKLMYVATSFNNWGAELCLIAGIGDQRDFGAQLWQPLGPGSPW